MGISIYNNLIKRKNRVIFSYGSLDIMLSKRHELILKWVRITKDNLKEEHSLSESLLVLRGKAMDRENGMAIRFELEQQISQLLGEFFVAIKSYPEFTSNNEVMSLHQSLKDIEEKISIARKKYNTSVIAYNNALKTVPKNIIAAAMSYSPMESFKATEVNKANTDLSKLLDG